MAAEFVPHKHAGDGVVSSRTMATIRAACVFVPAFFAMLEDFLLHKNMLFGQNIFSALTIHNLRPNNCHTKFLLNFIDFAKYLW